MRTQFESTGIRIYTKLKLNYCILYSFFFFYPTRSSVCMYICAGASVAFSSTLQMNYLKETRNFFLFIYLIEVDRISYRRV